MAGPGAAPRARRPDGSAAGTAAAGPAVAHREPRRGRSGGAGQWAAHPSQAARDAAAAAAAAATSGPPGSTSGPRVPGGAGEGSPPVRRRRSRAAARPSQLRRSAPGAAAVRLASAGSQDARACATHSLARGGSRRPGSRRPSPRESPPAAARRRREIRERRLGGRRRPGLALRPSPGSGRQRGMEAADLGRWEALQPPAASASAASRQARRDRRGPPRWGGESPEGRGN